MFTPDTVTPVAFGREFRAKYFRFDPSYLPLNHGSYGAFPTPVRDYQRQLQDSIESRSDPFIRYQIPKLLIESRTIVAKYLDAAVDEIVFVPNATTAVNTVLRNLEFEDGDVILYFSFAYPACIKTIQSVCETSSAQTCCINIKFPLEDSEISKILETVLETLSIRGSRARLLMFDTVLTFPGLCLPWKLLIDFCRKRGILSLVDGAHGIGHVDLRSIAQLEPDFFTSNCYKWLYTPRPCAVFYVPFRNHDLIRTSIPTSHGYLPRLEGKKGSNNSPSQTQPRTRFAELFQWVATVDQTPYLCIVEAVKFREQICGGEDAIRKYCFDLAEKGGELIATTLKTEVMRNSTRSINQCCFTNIRLPLNFRSLDNLITTCDEIVLSPDDGPAISSWIIEHSMTDYNTWIPANFYNGAIWVRISAQVYLELADFDKAARILLELCSRVQNGDWKGLDVGKV